MQNLYSFNSFPQTPFKEVERAYLLSINKSFSLFVYCLYLIREVISHYDKDIDIKSNRKILNNEDHINNSFFKSEECQSIVNSETIENLLRKFDLPIPVDADIIRNFFKEFTTDPEFTKLNTGKKDDSIELLLKMYKKLISNEVTGELISDKYSNWEDDESLITGSIKKVIKSAPLKKDFYEEYLPSEEATIELGEKLMYDVWNKKQEINQIIFPTLKNWDPKRVAIIDMLLLEMAVAEFLDFPTIPVNVTINEYIDISKIYSTPRSKEFINGILDTISVNLTNTNKINAKKLQATK